MNGSRPRYTVIILTWNSRQHIAPCLDSLAIASPDERGDLIVIDNGSRDGTPELVCERAPWARLIRNRENRGVAAARNQGLVLARTPFSIILDVDTVVLAGAFARLLDFLERAPSVAVCGPRLMLPDGSVQPSCQLFPTMLDKMIRQLPGAIGRRWLRDVELADWDHRGVRDVDYVVGACQAIRMEALHSVGWLDERIFYGPEDVDLCLRMHLQGWRVVYLGDAVVRHECQRVTRQRLNVLTLRHMLGLAHLYRTHRYLWSRAGLYRRIAAAGAPNGVPGQTAYEGAP
ncbi:MAG TPA: glycosyltransferase family 2 protein [Candidatus Binatia bacterium]|nr:glycosyltransferase family 2 protein [Candidatus Binatia bacterium]